MLATASTCLNCDKPLKGRSDKKYCNDGCRNAFTNKQKQKENKETGPITLVLRKNRRILMALLGDKPDVSVSEAVLHRKGFVFDYHTHHIITAYEKNEYMVCYDHGYRRLENGLFKVIKEFKKK